MLTMIVCSFPVLVIEIRGKLKSQSTKRAKNLLKHTHAAILPFTDAFKLQISAQKITFKSGLWSFLLSDKQKKKLQYS